MSSDLQHNLEIAVITWIRDIIIEIHIKYLHIYYKNGDVEGFKLICLYGFTKKVFNY